MTNTALKLAAGWSAAYGTLALGWTIFQSGFPYGVADPGRPGSALQNLDASVGAPLFAGVLLVTALVLLAMNGREVRPGPARTLMLGWVWTVAALLLVVVADVRLLTFAGYLPMLIVGLPFGWPPVDYSQVFTWTLGNEVLAVAGGLLLARAALIWQRRTARLCEARGRGDRPGRWTSPAAVARWGRVATWSAALIPATYAVVRLAWAAGIPLGISASFLDDLQSTGLVWAGAGLGAFGLVGSVLTIGLIRPWGERFPRWMAGLAGKRVPIRLATVPATLVAIFVMSASVSFYTTGGIRYLLSGDLTAATAPLLLWPLWAVALGAATLAYHLRRRAACERCGRGEEPAGLVPGAGTGAY